MAAQGKPALEGAEACGPLGSARGRHEFTQALMGWGRKHGRVGLPWQVRDGYAVWVSEVMLQQTQVETVKKYYEKFMALWPTVGALASASEDEVLAAWAGLGYYRRAKFLRKGALHVMESLGGSMPTAASELALLPGIGRSTAAAIASIAHGQAVAIMDGNVARVLARHWAFAEDVGAASAQKKLWATAESLVSHDDPGFYTQSIMDLGATVCSPKAPKCGSCPMAGSCQALALGRPEGYPVKEKKEKTRRVDREVWRVAHDGEKIALMKNDAQTGVWQSMIVFGLLEEPAGRIQDQWSFKHIFSHYDLHVEVVLCLMDPPALAREVKKRGLIAESPQKALALALPKPVRDVIERIDKHHQEGKENS